MVAIPMIAPFSSRRLRGLPRLLATLWLSILGLWFLGLGDPAYALSPPDGLIQDLGDGVDLANKNFSGLVLQDKRFTKLDLEGANFQKTDLRGTVFNGTDASYGNFGGADFSYGMAYHSVFRGADFTDAVLTGAYLLQSQFDGAIVTNADFTEAVLDLDQQRKLCKTASGTNPITGANTRFSLGCSPA
jgi:uncharacterized protein YjbI with pentapeptide repeats